MRIEDIEIVMLVRASNASVFHILRQQGENFTRDFRRWCNDNFTVMESQPSHLEGHANYIHWVVNRARAEYCSYNYEFLSPANN